MAVEVGVLEAVLRLRDELSAQLKTTTTNLAKTQKQLQSFGGAAMGAGLALSAGVTAPIVGLGAASVKLAGDLEQTRMAFTSMLGSAERADAFLREMKDFAAKTPFEFRGLMDSTKLMKAMGFETERLKPMLNSLGDAAAALGGGNELISRMVMQLGQMQAKGKVSAEEMRVLAQTGIPVWEILAEKIGMTIPAAMKAAEKGAISSTAGIEALVSGINDRFGGMMEVQAQTMLGRWSTLKDEVEFALMDLGEALLPLAKQLVDALIAAVPVVKSLTEAFAALPGPVKLGIIAIAGLVAAIGPLLFVLGGAAMGLSQVMALLAAPGVTGILATAGAIASVVAAFVAVAVAAWKGTEALISLGDKLRGVDESAKPAVSTLNVIMYALEGLWSAGKWLWEFDVALFETLTTGWISWVNPIGLVTKAVKALAVVLEKTVGLAAKVASYYAEGIFDLAGGADAQGQMNTIKQQQRLLVLAKASKIAGKEITDLGDALEVLKNRQQESTTETEKGTTAAGAAMAAAAAAAAAAKERAAAVKAYTKALSDMVATMSGAQLDEELAMIDRALQSIGGAAEASREAIERYGAVLSEAQLSGRQLTEDQLALVDAFNELNEKTEKTIEQMVALSKIDVKKALGLDKDAPKMTSTGDIRTDTLLRITTEIDKQTKGYHKQQAEVEVIKSLENDLLNIMVHKHVPLEEARKILAKIKGETLDTKSQTDKWKATLGNVASVASKVGDMLGTFAGLLGGAETSAGRLAGAMSSVANAASSVAQGFATGGLVGGLTAGVSALPGLVQNVGNAFRDVEHEEVNDLRDAWEDSIGTFDDLAAKAADAGVSLNAYLAADTVAEYEAAIADLEAAFEAADAREQMKQTREAFITAAGGIDELEKRATEAGASLDAMLEADTVAEYRAAIEDLQASLDLNAKANEEVNAAIEKYGFTIEELGPKWKQQRLDEMVGGLLKEYKLLSAAGVDHSAIIKKMGPNLNEYLQQAMAAGVAVPENMRPILEQMARMGVLTDAAGNKIEDLGGIEFTESLTDGLSRMIAAIDDLVNALLGIAPAAEEAGAAAAGAGAGAGGPRPGPGGRPPGYPPGMPWPPAGMPQYNMGTQGLKNFRDGTAVMLHNKENVQTESEYKAVMAALGTIPRLAAQAGGGNGQIGEFTINVPVGQDVLAKVMAKLVRDDDKVKLEIGRVRGV